MLSCHEGDAPFPYVPNLPDAYNLHNGPEDDPKGPVAMYTHEVYHEYYDGLVSQTTACFDSTGRCIDYYYRDRERCSHMRFEYDTAGRRIREEAWQDTAGTPFDSLRRDHFVTTYRYSANSRRCKARITDTRGKRYTFRLRYDRQGHLSRFIYPDGSRFSYDYDAAGRMVRRTWPDASTERFEYDAHGNMTSMTDRDGVVNWYLPPHINARRDSLGRVVEEVAGPSPGENTPPRITTYAYDSHGNWVRRTTAGVSSPTVLEVRAFRYHGESF